MGFKKDTEGLNVEIERVLEEKLLHGKGSPVMRKISLSESNFENNVELRLYEGRNNSYTLFGGPLAYMILPEDCSKHFELIKSKEDFLRISEEKRKSLVQISEKTRKSLDQILGR